MSKQDPIEQLLFPFLARTSNISWSRDCVSEGQVACNDLEKNAYVLNSFETCSTLMNIGKTSAKTSWYFGKHAMVYTVVEQTKPNLEIVRQRING